MVGSKSGMLERVVAALRAVNAPALAFEGLDRLVAGDVAG
jgi:hypothetical protein